MMDKEVKVIAMIRKNTTGEIREYETVENRLVVKKKITNKKEGEVILI